MRFDIKEDGKRILMVCEASLIMALNIKTFVRTGGLYPGGATGLTILIQRVADLFFGITIPYTLVNVILNAIPVYIGFRFIGKKFTLYSCLMIMLTGILTDMIPGYPITYDTLLISVFGCPGAGNQHLHWYFNFTGCIVETVLKSLRLSCGSEKNRFIRIHSV